MISAWELYLWTRLDIFSGVINAIPLIIGAISGLILTFADMGDKDCLPFKKTAKTAFICCTIWFITTAFIPTKKDFAMIWIVPKLATVENTELLKGEAAEIYTLAKEALKESIGVETKTEGVVK